MVHDVSSIGRVRGLSGIGVAGSRHPADRAPDPYRRALQRVGGGMALLYLVWVLPHWPDSDQMGAIGPVLVGVAVLAHLVLAFRGATGRMDARDVVVAGVAVVAMLAVDLGTEPIQAVGIQASPVYPEIALTLVISAGFLPLRWYWLAAVPVACTVYLAARTLADGAPALWAAVDELAADIGPLGVVAYTVTLYLRAGRRADDAVRTAEAADPPERAAEIRAEDATERRRVLHDEVIGSLVAVQHSDDAGVVREAAGRALLALEERDDAEPRIIGLPLARTPLQLDVDEVVLDRRVPQVVRRAMTAAAAEAVRNADRHAGASTITVRARSLPTGAVVSIVDDGVGFDTSGSLGFGVRHSIVDRMQEVGGDVTIVSAPGEGTTVTLQWQVSADEVYSPPETGTTWRFAAVVTALAACGLPWILARHVDQTREIPVMITALGLVVTAAAMTAGGRVRTRWVAVLAVALAGVTWWGLSLGGPAASIGFDAWIVTITCVPIFTLACFVRYVDLIGLGLVLSATVLISTVLDETSVSGPAQDAISQPLFFAVSFGALAAGLRRARLAGTRAELDLVDTLRRDVLRAARTRESAERDAALRHELVPFLVALRDGAMTAGTTEVTDRARALAAEVRDEIHLPGLLDDDLRRLFATARSGGSIISVRASFESQPLPSLAPLLRDVIEPSSRQRVTITLPGPQQPYTRIVVAPGLTGIGTAVRRLAEVDESPEATVITVHAAQSSR